MLRFFGLEIKIQCNERPITSIAPTQSIFHDRPNAFEEILFKSWFLSSDWSSVRNYRPRTPCARIGVPEWILFDGERSPSGERTIDPVCPPLEVGIAVVRVANTACPRFKRGMLSRGRNEGNEIEA